MRADTKFPASDLRTSDPKFRPPRYAEYLAAVAALDRFAQENFNKRVIHLALRWVLDRAPNTMALWGARQPGQLDPVGDVLGWKISADAMAEIDRIVAQHVRTPFGAWRAIGSVAAGRLAVWSPASRRCGQWGDLDSEQPGPGDDDRDRRFDCLLWRRRGRPTADR
jgi:aldo/keto reductase family protein